jgi:hypothetical protein
MAKVRLASGDVFVGIKHEVDLVPNPLYYPMSGKSRNIEQRRTKVWVETPMAISNPPKVIARGEARCHPRDNFNRSEGRKRAANRLLVELKNQGYSHADRKAIFQVICPEFFKTATAK